MTPGMRIVVGSTNAVKIDAVREILKDYQHLASAEVVGVASPSGVPDQPMSLEETVTGAVNRAKGAFRDCAYAVGIEGGLFPLSRESAACLEVAAIWDGTRAHLGFSPAFELPGEVLRLVREEGLELNDAVYRAGLTRNPQVRSAEGLVGILTKGRMTRKEKTMQALRMALIRLDP